MSQVDNTIEKEDYSVIIKKIFNNNVLLVKESSKPEMVVMGCGIAFHKKTGDKVEENLIEKTFILKQKDASEKFKLLLEDIPMKQVSLCYDIIEYAKNIIGNDLNDYIYVTLTDHINNVLKMFEEGIKFTNPLIWEIKKFYPKEYSIGLKALDFIQSELCIHLPEDEAVNIALHIINAQVNNTYCKMDTMAEQVKKIGNILNIVKYTYGIELDEKSLDYERFITHLRFFFQRLNKNVLTESEEDDYLLNQIKYKYEKAYECALKIEKYLEKSLSHEEQLYLTVHIQRITH